MAHIFPAPQVAAIPVIGSDDSYPIHRIFCVGRNYVAHAAEMGGQVDREAPWYFTKSTAAYCDSGRTVAYPPGTANYHHEVELVIALGADAFEVDQDAAQAAIFGYGVGLDMTRRDRQQDGKDHRRPWDLGKDVELSAPIAALTRAADLPAIGDQRISLTVNDELRQDAVLSDMVWSCAEIISHLSHYYHLRAGDVIMTGTPAGVGPVVAGDRIVGQIDGLAPVIHNIEG